MCRIAIEAQKPDHSFQYGVVLSRRIHCGLWLNSFAFLHFSLVTPLSMALFITVSRHPSTYGPIQATALLREVAYLWRIGHSILKHSKHFYVSEKMTVTVNWDLLKWCNLSASGKILYHFEYISYMTGPTSCLSESSQIKKAKLIIESLNLCNVQAKPA